MSKKLIIFCVKIMKKITDQELSILINGLTDHKRKGVIDPWVLADGAIIEPLDVLLELQELRAYNADHDCHASPEDGCAGCPKQI